MPGDYTRLTFDPRLDRALLFEQQGRVHLDADFNELGAILERRLRVETRDFAGPAAVPASLPNSFKIDVNAGVISVEPGRIYVDGLLAENHGDAKTGKVVYEPVWGEPGYDQPTALPDQPYVGGAANTVPGQFDRTLAYLDVWQREVTAVEDESIVEPALGVDTCTRWQTAWQVRLLGLSNDQDCSSDWSTDPDWLAATQPSSGLLSSRAVKPPAPSDPCAVAPVGGYRGLENRLYRVEIHDHGAAGQATMKWSRDNGAVAARITGPITTPGGARPVVPVERLGRDSVLRFNKNDWVEVLDDARELDGIPGVIAQVYDTDPSANTVTLTGPVSGLPSIATDRNPRLRRWDQQNGLTAGVIPLSALPQTVDLEDGVQAILDLAPADPSAPAGAPAPEFKTGDWWVFAARAATASVEELDEAAPRGIRHHYARLAIITGGAVTSDCRVIFPGDCNCDGGDCHCQSCVTPESHRSGILTIQDAVNKVGPGGGRVCLAPGRYVLRRPLEIRGARSLTIEGAGSATLLTYEGAGAGIVVYGSAEVSLERFALAVAATGRKRVAAVPEGGTGQRQAASPVVGIALDNTIDCSVRRCFVIVGFVPGERVAAGAAADAAFAGFAAAPRMFGAGDVGIGLLGIAMRTRLLDNVVFAATAIGDLTGARSDLMVQETDGGGTAAVDPGALRTAGVVMSYADVGWYHPAYLLSADLAIVDNLLIALRVGIDFGAGTSASLAGAYTSERIGPTIHMAATRIADNLIIATAIASIVLLGLGSTERPPAWHVPSGPTGGVKVPSPPPLCTQVAGARRDLTGLVNSDPALVKGGIQVGVEVGGDMIVVSGNVMLTTGCGVLASPEGIVIRDNQIVGAARSSSRWMVGVLVGANRGSAGGRVTVSDNWIRQFALGGVMAAGSVGALTVNGNRIVGMGMFGIGTADLSRLGQVSVVDNTISEVAPSETGTTTVLAIWVVRSNAVRISGNVVTEIARTNWTGGLCAGVMVAGSDWAEVSGNQLIDIGPDNSHSDYVLGIAGQEFGTLDIRGNMVSLGDSGGASIDVPLWVEPITATAAIPLLAFVPTASATAAASSGAAAAAGPAELELDTEVLRTMIGWPDLGVSGNALSATGVSSVACINSECNVVFSENRCVRDVPNTDNPTYPVVTITTRFGLIVSSNRVEGIGNRDVPVVDLYPISASKLPMYTVLGNIATGPINVNGSPLGSPWNPLNVVTP